MLFPTAECPVSARGRTARTPARPVSATWNEGARGYELAGRSRPVREEDFERFDCIVAMDSSNYQDLETMGIGGPAELRLFSDFLPPGSPTDVPDPYYVGGDGFDCVLDLLEVGCPALLEAVVP